MTDNKETIYIGFDGEFSGPNLIKNYVIAWGAYAIDKKLNKIDEFYVALKVFSERGFNKETKKYFWDKPENQELLKMFEKDAISPKKAMKKFTDWLDNLNEKYNIILVCDCCADSSWMDYYLAVFTNKNSLIQYGGNYTGWPHISDDAYRGILKINDGWGLDKKIYKKYPKLKKSEPGNHHPTEDAREIIELYVQIMNAK